MTISTTYSVCLQHYSDENTDTVLRIPWQPLWFISSPEFVHQRTVCLCLQQYSNSPTTPTISSWWVRCFLSTRGQHVSVSVVSHWVLIATRWSVTGSFSLLSVKMTALNCPTWLVYCYMIYMILINVKAGFTWWSCAFWLVSTKVCTN